MRDNSDGTSVFLWGVSAAVLAASVLLSACASKGARQESSLYSQDHSLAGPRNKVAAVPPPPPIRARRAALVRGYQRLAGPAGQQRLEMNDEARYSAIYGVPPRADYLRAPAPETSVTAAPLPPVALQRAIPRSRSAFRKSSPRSEKRIVVTRGDTLYNLAWRYKTTVTALLRANRLARGNLEVGQELIIPGV